MTYLQIIFLVIITATASFLGAYLKEKAKSTATKSDIEVITRKIEEVKKELNQQDRIASKKYELKYNACLNMLGILDAHLSNILSKNNEGKTIPVDRQFTTPEDARKCHNDLLITIDNPAIMELFLNMMGGKSKNLIIDLDKLRKLVREELGFGSDFRTDEDNTWLAVITCKPEN